MNVESIISSISLISWRRRFALWATNGAPLTDLKKLDKVRKNQELSDDIIGQFSTSIISWVKNAPNFLPEPFIGLGKISGSERLLIGIASEKLLAKEMWIRKIRQDLGVEINQEVAQYNESIRGDTEIAKLVDVTL